MVKNTKRKGFNFFRSYFDVYNELSDKDKVQFMNALLDRQFLGIKPEGLTGMAKFAYISQTNSIDSQVKGYEDKTGIKLSIDGGLSTPTVGGKHGGYDTPTLQVEEKEKEKVEYTIDFDLLLKFINKTLNKNFKTVNNKAKQSYKARLKDGYTKEDITNAVKNSIKDSYHKETNFKYLTPEYFSRPKTLDLFSQKNTSAGLSIKEQTAHIKNNVGKNSI
tara:strand:+ start:364 stop:1020 length:657 start_codon:yes stop_codon:yes gene_type:complete